MKAIKKEGHMNTYIETVIIGGGQAGLAVSYYLSQQGRPHVVLEQAAQAGNAWRNHRWDSFTLNTPNWQSALPGAEIPGAGPDGFLSREEVVAYFENYVERFHLPVRYGVRVESVVPKVCGRGYVVETSVGSFDTRNVVIATGLYQMPKPPAVNADFPLHIKQIHSDEYRNPQALPDGAVLVVGSGQSGAQIAEELYQSGRKIYFSVSRAGRVPRRYRGKDANWWHDKMGDYEKTVDQLPSPQAKFASKPQISGKDGGHTLNLHQFARDGVMLLGRVQGVSDGNVLLAQDLRENLARADKFEADFVQHVDEFITKNGIDAPEEKLPALCDGYDVEQVTEVNLADANITSVIWATGYSFDFSMVRLPVFDDDGYPVQKRGITDYPGLYFVGLPWLHNAKSGLLFGLSQDAAYIVAAIKQESRLRGLDRAEVILYKRRGDRKHRSVLVRKSTIIGAEWSAATIRDKLATRRRSRSKRCEKEEDTVEKGTGWSNRNCFVQFSHFGPNAHPQECSHDAACRYPSATHE
jgi:putative flavoprotein involved in K+ transport